MDENDVQRVMAVVAELETSVKELSGRFDVAKKVTDLQNEAIGLLFPLMIDIGRDESVPEPVRRRIDFAMKQMRGISEQVLAL